MTGGGFGGAAIVLVASHASMRDDFEISTPELDDVVRLEDRYGRADSARDK